MTPVNVVNMALVSGLDIIAVTDHNSVGNCRAAVAAGEAAGVVVVPGMEICCSEEIHAVCLFADCDNAEAFGAVVDEALPKIKNRPEIFGRQILMDDFDNAAGTIENLLTVAGEISIDELPALCARYGGVCYPAHIDRPSYSILTVLGMIDGSMGFNCAEISQNADEAELMEKHPALAGMRILHASDAHSLEMMAGDPFLIALTEKSARAVIDALGSK
jgi:hypothetical protein